MMIYKGKNQPIILKSQWKSMPTYLLKNKKYNLYKKNIRDIKDSKLIDTLETSMENNNDNESINNDDTSNSFPKIISNFYK